jgi:phage-related protein
MSTPFYDRTTGNITGVGPLSFLSVSPAYGSVASFYSRENQYETQNGYYNAIPLSVNNLNAKFELRFDLPEKESQELVSFLERKKGEDFITFDDPSNFYRPVSGVCDNYAINHINKRHYEVAAGIEVHQASSILNWSGSAFVNALVKTWSISEDFKKYDILYSGVNETKFNNFYYCTEDHTSSSESVDGPTGVSPKWTQQFFFEPDVGLQNDVKMRVDTLDFKNSFIQKIRSSKNTSVINLNYKFDNIDTKKAKAILHFLENKMGYRRFFHKPVSVYNRLKVFRSPTWRHTWNYLNSHNIEVNLIEDPLGIVPIDGKRFIPPE